MKELRCPCCNSDFIEIDDCLDTGEGENSLIERYCGYCMDCGANLTWHKVFVFSEYCNVKVDD
jgi:hypothetical protein